MTNCLLTGGGRIVSVPVMEITEAQIEAAARALAKKIELDESRWFLYAHAAQLALEAAARVR